MMKEINKQEEKDLRESLLENSLQQDFVSQWHYHL